MVKQSLILALAATVAALVGKAEGVTLQLGTPFADGAVLQRGMKVPVWGKAVGGAVQKVKVEFAGQTKVADVCAGGAWKVELDPMEASKESRTMTVCELGNGEQGTGNGGQLEIKDILVGEVWFASGQSNMECPLWWDNPRYRDKKGGLLATMTRLPNVRYVKCKREWSVEPKEFSAKWRKLTPECLQQFNGGSGFWFSAVAFYYARELYLALDIPIGIIDASWGGTNIDAWTPRCGYDNCDPSIKSIAEYPVKADRKPEEYKGRWPLNGPQQQPTVIYNGMVASFAPMAMRGVIWYQGCHNGCESKTYCARLHALYEGWRREFANPDLKFYLVQLAPWKSSWLGICMAQTKFCAEEKNAALAVTADVGNFDDVHPNDKEIVAQRLVVHALKRDYGFAIPEEDSPVVKSVSFKDGMATVAFANVKNWYVYTPDRQHNPAFELAGEDGEWKPAVIVNFRKGTDKDGNPRDTDFIDGPELVLKSELVPDPVRVRYMGQPRTSSIIYNEASLPLGPFESGAVSGQN